MARHPHIGLIVTALLAAPLAPARAVPVTLSFAGTITGASGDIAALFGAGSILGQTITGTVTYDTANFSAPQACSGGGCLYWDSTSGTLPAYAIQITETIAGVSFHYLGGYFSELLLANAATPGAWPYGAGSSGWIQALQVASDNVTSDPLPGAPSWSAASINLGMTTAVADLVNPALDPAGPFDLAATQVQSNGSNWSTPTSAVSWSFTLDAVEVAEPSSLSVLAGMTVGFGALRRRRTMAT